MKLAKILLGEDTTLPQDNTFKKEPTKEVDPMRSNIDQFWMNTEDLKSDLYKFLKRVQTKDPELARNIRNTIRTVISKFRYNPEQQRVK